MSKKIFAWLIPLILVVIVIIAILAFTVWKPQPKQEETIKIGAILPLTGSAAFAGEQARDGMIMAIEDINNAGGINGKKLELILEDSKGSPQEGITAFNNLVLKNVSLIVSGLSSVSAALVPLAKEKEVPLLITIASTPELPKNEWTFRYYPTANQEIPPLLSIAKDLKIKKIAVLYLNDEFGVSMFNTLKKEFNGTVLGESFMIATGDFRTEIIKLKSENPDAILVVGFSSHLINAIKQLKELNVNIPIFTPSTAAFKEIRTVLKENNIEVYAGVPKVYGENINENVKNIKEKFEQKYNKEFDHYVATGYDLVKIIEQTIKTSGKDRKEIKEGLSKLNNFTGILGDIEINGRELSFYLYPARISEGISFI